MKSTFPIIFVIMMVVALITSALTLRIKGQAITSWVFVNKKRAGTDTLMGAGTFYMPVISQGKALGVIGIFCTNEISTQDNKIFLRMIASQVAMALERQRLSDEQRYLMVEAKKKRLDMN